MHTCIHNTHIHTYIRTYKIHTHVKHSTVQKFSKTDDRMWNETHKYIKITK